MSTCTGDTYCGLCGAHHLAEPKPCQQALQLFHVEPRVKSDPPSVFPFISFTEFLDLPARIAPLPPVDNGVEYLKIHRPLQPGSVCYPNERTRIARRKRNERRNRQRFRAREIRRQSNASALAPTVLRTAEPRTARSPSEADFMSAIRDIAMSR